MAATKIQAHSLAILIDPLKEINCGFAAVEDSAKLSHAFS